MIGRLFWMAVGATAGVVAVRKVTNTAKAYSPAGMSEGLTSLGEGLRELAVAVRKGMAERDAELRLALGIDEGVMDAGTAQALIDHPTANHPTGQFQASQPTSRPATPGRLGATRPADPRP